MLKKRKAEKTIFMNSRKQRKFSHSLLFFASLFFTSVYIIWRMFFTLPLKFGNFALVLGIFLLIAEAMAAIESMIQYRQINKRMVPELPDIPEAWYPDVDILVATHNESAELLYKTLNACNYLHYPDKSKIHIYLCDDANRPEMAELARKLNVGYFGLEKNEHAKAGNLNNALKQTNSPLVVTFDADMIPTGEFLMKTVPYFFLPMLKKDKETGQWEELEASERDPDFKIGFIQTPQSFYNPDLFQYNLFSEGRVPNEQDYFFREVNVGRNADNAVIYAGSNTVLSRRALEEVGYIAVGSITEDFMTGIRIQKKGYSTYAIPHELAHGLAPDSITSLIKQRERWGRGCIQALRQEKLLASKMPIWSKLSYFAAWSYWWAFARRMIYIISPVFAILFNLPIMGVLTWQVVTFWLPHYLLGNQVLKMFSNGVRNKHWSNVYDTIMFPYLVGPIILEAMGIKKRKFVVTEKRKSTKKTTRSILFSLPHVEILIVSVIALIICIQRSIIIHSIYSPVIFFWLVVNIKNLIFAVFFMFGRKNYRFSERYYASAPVEMKHGAGVIHAETSDISEAGMAILFNKPVYFPPDEPIKLHISAKEYAADMEVKIVHVVNVGERWKYSVLVTEIDDENLSQYMQIVYDREHTMPRTLDPTLSMFDDFNINLTKRARQVIFNSDTRFSRVLPRISLKAPFTLDNGEQGVIVDFNFQYAVLNKPIQLEPDECILFELKPGVSMCLAMVSEDAEAAGGFLYRVTNTDDFNDLNKINEFLDFWTDFNNGTSKAELRASVISKVKAKED